MVNSLKEVCKEYIFPLIIVVFLSFVISRIFPVLHVSGASMEPTYTDNQMLFSINQNLTNIEYDDVITFKIVRPSAYETPEILIKRVVGLPGDSIEVVKNTDGTLDIYRNDTLVRDDVPCPDNSNNIILHLHLGEDEYYVLGDNSKVSYDSRFFGTVRKENIISKVMWSEPL